VGTGSPTTHRLNSGLVNQLLRRLRNIDININQQRQRWPKHGIPSAYRRDVLTHPWRM